MRSLWLNQIIASVMEECENDSPLRGIIPTVINFILTITVSNVQRILVLHHVIRLNGFEAIDNKVQLNGIQ